MTGQRWRVWGPRFRRGREVIAANLSEAEARALAAERNRLAARHGGTPATYVATPTADPEPD
jgi:alkylation response protein AidB-like acyl-CoA dehydrogenase